MYQAQGLWVSELGLPLSFRPRAGGQSQDWNLTQWGWIELDFVPRATVDRGGVTLKGVASRVGFGRGVCYN